MFDKMVIDWCHAGWLSRIRFGNTSVVGNESVLVGWMAGYGLKGGRVLLLRDPAAANQPGYTWPLRSSQDPSSSAPSPSILAAILVPILSLSAVLVGVLVFWSRSRRRYLQDISSKGTSPTGAVVQANPLQEDSGHASYRGSGGASKGVAAVSAALHGKDAAIRDQYPHMLGQLPAGVTQGKGVLGMAGYGTAVKAADASQRQRPSFESGGAGPSKSTGSDIPGKEPAVAAQHISTMDGRGGRASDPIQSDSAISLSGPNISLSARQAVSGLGWEQSQKTDRQQQQQQYLDIVNDHQQALAGGQHHDQQYTQHVNRIGSSPPLATVSPLPGADVGWLRLNKAITTLTADLQERRAASGLHALNQQISIELQSWPPSFERPGVQFMPGTATVAAADAALNDLAVAEERDADDEEHRLIPRPPAVVRARRYSRRYSADAYTRGKHGSTDSCKSSGSPGAASSVAGGTTPQLQLTELLGQGTFGAVYRGSWKGSPVAVKVMQLLGSGGLPGGHPREHMAVKEAAISVTVSHPHIVQVFTYMLKPLTLDNDMDVGGCSAPAGIGQLPGGSEIGDQQAVADEQEEEATAAASNPVLGWELRLVMEYCELVSLQSYNGDACCHG